MVNRASGPLLVAYLMILSAGAFFIGTPSLVLADSTEYNQLILIWGLFYLIGGLVSAISLLGRGLLKNNISLWYFETSGIALTVTANLVYAYALGRSGIHYHEGNIIALSMILIAFSAGLVARCVETLRLVRILTGVVKGKKG